ncbi:MAG: hypothetical protein NWE95_01840 [Candidatus Bathyarchaeota archaeon]|nr:hypothetical protein [Candidatus Bathyarchaeota archaeon]
MAYTARGQTNKNGKIFEYSFENLAQKHLQQVRKTHFCGNQITTQSGEKILNIQLVPLGKMHTTRPEKNGDKALDDWSKLSLDPKRKALIFVILKYQEMLGAKLTIDKLRSLSIEHLEKLSHNLKEKIKKL